MTPRSTLLEQAVKPLYWILMVFALWILFRGHNEPGGGFIGGLIAVTGSSLLAITLNTQAARRWQPFSPLNLAVLGVGMAFLTGLLGVAAGLPFLTHLWTDMGVSSVMLFDLGVFFVVWGSLTGYIYPLLEEPDEEKTS
jgi:multicomponent Na+:H+ antiporter subunit B